MNAVELEALRQMIREEMETVLRRVVREELAALVAAGLAQPLAPPVVPAPSLEEFLTSFAHPYSLSERELRQAESLMPPEEAAIYRKRCYAWRAANQGNAKAAKLLRAQADSLEKRMVAKR